MLLVGFPYWVQTGKDLAMFYQQPLKMARFIERSEEIDPAFWMCREHDPFAFVGFDKTLVDHLAQDRVGMVHEWFNPMQTLAIPRRHHNH